MLAQNFKSAEALGLKDREHAALVKVLGMLERGELAYVKKPKSNAGITDKFTGHFNMASWRTPDECGTVACIGGTAEIIGALRFNGDQLSRPGSLRRLFFPSRMEERTVEEAATALRSYLTTGEAEWS